MPKIQEIKTKNLIKVLHKLGFVSRVGKGSHTVFKHKDGRRTVVPIHNRPLRIGTFKAILKQINCSVEDFLKIY